MTKIISVEIGETSDGLGDTLSSRSHLRDRPIKSPLTRSGFRLLLLLAYMTGFTVGLYLLPSAILLVGGAKEATYNLRIESLQPLGLGHLRYMNINLPEPPLAAVSECMWYVGRHDHDLARLRA